MVALNNRWIVTSLSLLLAACESSPAAPPPSDAALDRSLDAAGDLGDELKSSPDVELDDDVSAPDDLPAPPTGCHLLSDAGPALPASDAGLPEPGAYPPLRGPGGPSRTFTTESFTQPCAFLDGGPTDRDHHNTVLMYDGYLVMPWAHESGGGGVSVWDFSDACHPVSVSTTTDARMRESHTAGFSPIGGCKRGRAVRIGCSLAPVHVPSCIMKMNGRH